MSAAIEQEIMSLEHRLAEAKRTLDLEAIDRLYADDLVLTGVLGEPSCSKGALLDEVARGRAERDGLAAPGQFERTVANEDMTVIASGDAAVANYRFIVTVIGPHVDIRRRFRTTNVWMKRNGRWQIVAAHTAFVVDPKRAALFHQER